IFPLIQRHAKVELSEMYEVFNMGIGFCYVVDPAASEHILAILKAHGRVAQVIGTTVSDAQKIVRIPVHSLAGQHKRFWHEDAGKRQAGGWRPPSVRWAKRSVPTRKPLCRLRRVG